MHLRLSIGPCITVYGKKKKQSEDYFAAVKWHVLDFLSKTALKVTHRYTTKLSEALFYLGFVINSLECK